MLFCRNKKFKKRDCDVKMRLVPYGGGWTDGLKKHGFYGYHQATYYNDINIRHLLFLKAVALDNFEARKLTFYQEKGKGETSSFEREIELLLADM